MGGKLGKNNSYLVTCEGAAPGPDHPPIMDIKTDGQTDKTEAAVLYYKIIFAKKFSLYG